jgi:hypothetical protein
MSNNAYATPKSTLEVNQENKPAFFVVAPVKFVIMMTMTWGFYYIYWSYKNWKLYKMSTGTNISPFIRAYFNIFFVYSLFQRINQNIEKTGRNIVWSPKSRGVALIGSQLLGTVQSLFVFFELSMVLSLVFLSISTSLLIGAQRAINCLEDDPRGDSNSKFTLLNYVCMLPGFVFWVLILLSGILYMGMADSRVM